MKQFPTLLLAFGAAACGSQQADYEGAMERHWPAYLADERESISFYEERIAFLKRAEEAESRRDAAFAGRERRARFDSDPGDEMLSDARAKLEKAQYFAQAKFQRISDVSCACAAALRISSSLAPRRP